MNKHPLASCSSCPLKEQPYVPTKFPKGTPFVAVVGIAPAQHEVITGEPYTGASGKLMKDVLRKQGIDPNSCLYTNVLACKLIDEDAAPPKEAIDACSKRLQGEIKQSGTTRILATGAVAAKAILRTGSGILKERVGPPKRLQDGTIVVATVHPASALRTSDHLPFLATDTRKLVIETPQWESPRFRVADSEARAVRYIQFLRNFDTLAVDIETGTEKDVAFEHPNDTEILCVGVAYDRRHAVIFPGEILRIPIVGKLFGLLLANARLTGQNIKFDEPVLHQFHQDIKFAGDTMLYHYVLDERKGIHGLEPMAMELLGTPPWKWMTKQYTSGGFSFAAVPRPVLYEYNAIDCCTTFALDELFVQQIEAQGPKRVGLFEFLLRASSALMPVEREGVNVDLPYLEKLDVDYQTELAALEQPLQEWVDNPRSHDQVRAAFARLGVDLPSTRMPLLQELRKVAYEYESSVTQARDVVRLIDALEEYRKAHKLYTTYVRGLRKRITESKVHTSYLLHGTVFGRLSSRNPNLQNQPRGPTIRKAFVPGYPDHVLIKADYAQGETRVVAVLADEQYLIQQFLDGVDVIATIQGELNWPRNMPRKDLRVKTKNVVYGSWYGMVLGRGDQGLDYAKRLDMHPDEAYAYQKRFFSLVPNVIQWQKDTRAFVLNGGVLENYKGRRRHFYVTPQNKHKIMNECLPFKPQSSLSDMCLTALCMLTEAGQKVRLSTHDELVVECHKDNVIETGLLVARTMEEAAKEFSTAIRFPAEMSVGRSWGDMEPLHLN